VTTTAISAGHKLAAMTARRDRASKVASFAAKEATRMVLTEGRDGLLFKRLVRAVLQRFPDITEQQIEQAFDLLLTALAEEDRA
jgi:hypothetical protein